MTAAEAVLHLRARAHVQRTQKTSYNRLRWTGIDLEGGRDAPGAPHEGRRAQATGGGTEMTEHATRAAWVAIYELPDPSFMERWTFAHVSGNGSRQASRKRYTTKWGAKRAARKLYPDVEIREKPAR